MNDLGLPLREVYDPERDGWYEVDDSVIDYSQAALDEYRKTTKDMEPGVQLRVVDTYKGEDERPEAARRLPHQSRDVGLEYTGPGLEGTQDLSG